jgi:hypothetical protein
VPAAGGTLRLPVGLTGGRTTAGQRAQGGLSFCRQGRLAVVVRSGSVALALRDVVECNGARDIAVHLTPRTRVFMSRTWLEMSLRQAIASAV